MASTTRKAFSLLLSIALALGLCPLLAFGEPTTEQSPNALEQQTGNESTSEEVAPQTPPSANSSGTEPSGSTGNVDSEAIGDETSPQKNRDTNENASSDSNPPSDQNVTASPNETTTDYSSIDALAAANSDTLVDGTYVFASALGSSKVLGIASSSKANSAKSEIRTCSMASSQKWVVSHDSRGYVTLTNANSGKVLDVKSARTENGTAIQQYQPNDTRAQKWIAQKTASGFLTFTSALDTSFVLDVKSGKTSNGTPVQLHKSNESKAQSWTPYLVDPKVSMGEDLDLGNDWYTITTSISPSYCLDVASASTKDKANVQLYSSNSTFAQMWRFDYHDGFYLIINAASGKALDVAGGSVVPGANVQQCSPNPNNANQLFSAKTNDDGSVTFINKASGLVLDVSGGKAQNNRNVQAYSDNKSSAQKWVLSKVTTPIATGTCSISSALSSSKFLDVKSASTSQNATIQIYGGNSSFAQKWYVSPSDSYDGSVSIESLNSGLRLTDTGNGAVAQKTATSSSNQAWKPSLSDGGYITFINVATGNALDVKGAKTKNGTIVQGYKPNNSKAQQWRLNKTSEFSAGTYFLRSSANASKVIDVKSANKNNGANVQLYSSNSTAAQKWKTTKNSDGTYTFVNCNSGKALDVKSGKAASGTNVQQYSSNGTKSQKWKVTYTPGGFKITSALSSNLVLDVSGGSMSNGANIQIYADNNTTAQRFTFEPTSYTAPKPVPATSKQAMVNKAAGYSSGTKYLILVNRGTHKVGVFKGSKNNWKLYYYWDCVTGAPSTPTIKGTFRTTGYTRTSLSTDSRARWCTQIWGGYFFHTILASNSELGKSLSHGCIRMSYTSAKWIYNNVNTGTTVVIYN